MTFLPYPRYCPSNSTIPRNPDKPYERSPYTKSKTPSRPKMALYRLSHSRRGCPGRADEYSRPRRRCRAIGHGEILASPAMLMHNPGAYISRSRRAEKPLSSLSPGKAGGGGRREEAEDYPRAAFFQSTFSFIQLFCAPGLPPRCCRARLYSFILSFLRPSVRHPTRRVCVCLLFFCTRRRAAVRWCSLGVGASEGVDRVEEVLG